MTHFETAESLPEPDRGDIAAVLARKRTHDLDRLIEGAQGLGHELPIDADEVIALTQYAVPFRYDDLLDSEPLDRDKTIAVVDCLEDWARARISNG